MAFGGIFSNLFMKSIISKQIISMQQNLSLVSNYIKFKPILTVYSPSYVLANGKKTIAEELGIPEPPKKPPTPFIQYVLDEGNKYEQLKVTERIAKLAQDWAVLNESTKEKYVANFNKSWEKYQISNTTYLDSLTEVQISQIKEMKQRRRNDKKERKIALQHKKLRKEAENLGKPKHPGNQYSIFAHSVKGKGEVPDNYNYMKYVSQKWQSLSNEQKAYYEKEADRRSEIYQKELLEWESKMEASGRGDLVRKTSLKSNSTKNEKLQN